MNTIVTSYYLLITALLLDRLLGEPRRWHPLVGFGRIVHRLELWNLGQSSPTGSAWQLRVRGMAAVIALLVLVLVPLAWLLQLSTAYAAAHWLLQALLLYFCIGWRSLEQHAVAIQRALEKGDLTDARRQVAMIVSRDTTTMDEHQIARGATESVLENGSDAIFAPLFWFCVGALLADLTGMFSGGALWAVAYRLSNTLDAMWGYRTARFNHFGWFAAKLDDVLNYLPARLCAVTYSLSGNTRSALACWKSQAAACSSPNAGPVMSAGAGALQVQLGGPASYHGELQNKPLLGSGRPANARDIVRACQLINRSLLLWLVTLGVVWAVSTYGAVFVRELTL